MRRLFLLVAAVVLVDTMFFSAIAPLLPHYSDELDLTKTGAGVLTASYPVGTLAGSLPGGWLAARWGVKPTLLMGIGLLGVASLVFAFANHIVLLDAARFVQGFGGAFMWTAGMAWLVLATPPQRRGELIGSAFAAPAIGVLLGPVLGGAATEVGDEVVFSAVAAVAAGLAVWALTVPGIAPQPSPGLWALGRALRRREVLIAFWLFSLPALYAGVVEVLAPLRLGDLGASGAAIGAVFFVSAIGDAILNPFAGRLSDRRGRLTPIRLGLVGAIATAVLLPLPESTVMVGVAVFLAFATLAGIWAPAMAMLSDTSEAVGLDQALAFSIANISWGAGQLVGSGGGGALADATADAVPYALLGLVCLVTLAGVRSRDRLVATLRS